MTDLLVADPVPLEVLDPEQVLRRARAYRPWSPERFVRVVGANVAGVALMAVSWYQTDQQESVGAQLGWFNLALVGLGVCGLANGLWLLHGRQVVGLARAQLLPEVVRPEGDDEAPPPLEGSAVVGDGMTRYHRSDCPLVAGRTTRAIGRRGDDTSLRPCGVCEP